MLIREANIYDIPQLQVVRNSVTENILSDPSMVTEEDYRGFLTCWGKGWVCEDNGKILGFAIADLIAHKIWALFIQHGYEEKGIGSQLHQTMLAWYFSQTTVTVWLSTAAGTKAETFYRSKGWQELGPYGKGEIQFQMTLRRWQEVSLQKACES